MYDTAKGTDNAADDALQRPRQRRTIACNVVQCYSKPVPCRRDSRIARRSSSDCSRHLSDADAAPLPPPLPPPAVLALIVRPGAFGRLQNTSGRRAREQQRCRVTTSAAVAVAVAFGRQTTLPGYHHATGIWTQRSCRLENCLTLTHPHPCLAVATGCTAWTV